MREVYGIHPVFYWAKERGEDGWIRVDDFEYYRDAYEWEVVKTANVYGHYIRTPIQRGDLQFESHGHWVNFSLPELKVIVANGHTVRYKGWSTPGYVEVRPDEWTMLDVSTESQRDEFNAALERISDMGQGVGLRLLGGALIGVILMALLFHTFHVC